MASSSPGSETARSRIRESGLIQFKTNIDVVMSVLEQKASATG